MRFRGAGIAGGGASCWGVGFGVIWEKGTGPRASREPEGRSVLRRRHQLTVEKVAEVVADFTCPFPEIGLIERALEKTCWS
jgi:hypothetical protein